MSKNVISKWEWYKLDRPRREKKAKERRLYDKKYNATRRTYSNCGAIIAVKRPKPKDGLCEVCEFKPLIAYHHWLVKDKKAYGVWVCPLCHALCNRTDKHPARRTPEKYLTLKEHINATY